MIRELEKELNCNLLIRTNSGITLSNQGVYFVNECRAILNRKNLLCSQIIESENFPIENINLGFSYGIISYLSYKVISEFENKFPYIKINYTDQPDLYLELLLKKNDFDFCLNTGVVDTDVFSSKLLSSQPVYLVIPATHEIFGVEDIKMENLKDYKFAMFSTQFNIHHNFLNCCENAGFKPNIAITSNDFNSLMEIAIADNFLFVVPEHTISYSDDLRYVPFPDDKLVWSVYFVMKKSKVLSEGMSSFYQYLLNFVDDKINK